MPPSCHLKSWLFCDCSIAAKILSRCLPSTGRRSRSSGNRHEPWLILALEAGPITIWPSSRPTTWRGPACQGLFILSDERKISARPGFDAPTDRGLGISFGVGSDRANLMRVARKELSLLWINPDAPLALAYKGRPPFTEPLPLRVSTGSPIAPPFDDDPTMLAVDALIGTAGFSLDDIRAWGGAVRSVSRPSHPDRQFRAVRPRADLRGERGDPARGAASSGRRALLPRARLSSRLERCSRY